MRPENRVIVNNNRSPINNTNNKNYSKNLVIEAQPVQQFVGLDKRYNNDDNSFDEDTDQNNYNRQPQVRPYMARTAFVPEQQQSQKSPTQINQLYSSPKPILKPTNRKFTPV